MLNPWHTVNNYGIIIEGFSLKELVTLYGCLLKHIIKAIIKKSK